MYVENTHTRCIPVFTSFLTVPLTSGSAFWHVQRLFRIWNFEASRTQIWVRGSLRDRDFGAPLIKILFFGPLDSTEKITTNGLLGDSNRRLLILLQSLRPTGLVGSFIFKYCSDFLLFNTTYAFDGCKWVREAFLPFFYLKIIKGRPARKMMWVFILFILLVAQLLRRRDAIPYRPIFI